MKTAITTTQEFLSRIDDLSIVRPDVAAARPLVDIFTATMDAAAHRSDDTKDSYTRSICSFLQWVGETQEIPVEWTPLAYQTQEGRSRPWAIHPDARAVVLRIISAATVDAWVRKLTQEGMGENSCRTRVAAVNSFLAVAYRENVITEDQARRMDVTPYKAKRRRHTTVAGRRLSPEEARKLRQVTDTASLKGKRDQAILDCGLFAGLRRSEIAELTPADLVMDNGQWHLVVLGKGGKTRRIPIHPDLYATLTDWMDAAGIDFHDQERPLFVTVDKWGNAGPRAIDPGVVYRVTQESAAAARIAPATGKHALHPHDMRRTFARNLYDNGAGLPDIQYLLGHSSPATTAEYIGIDGAKSAGAISRLSY